MTHTLASWFHTLDPNVFRISGDLSVKWYGLSYVAGFLLAWLLLHVLATRRLVAIPVHRVPDAMTWLFFGIVAGGRLLYVLVYDRSLLTSFTSTPPWWGLLAVHKGGMASHGAMIGCVLAAWRISRGWPDGPDGTRVGRCSTLHVMDFLALASPLGLLLGRLANFINGELLGKVVAPAGQKGPWWTVQFPQELLGWTGPGTKEVLSHTPDLSPAQLAALNQLVTSQIKPGESWQQALRYVVSRAEQFRPQLEPLVSARHPSQLYQALAEGLVLGLVVWTLWARPRKAGLIAAAWLIVYGVLRVVTELWRLPDAQFGSQGKLLLDLSRGQWLSVGMVAVGVALLVWSAKRPGQPIGGWATPKNDR